MLIYITLFLCFFSLSLDRCRGTLDQQILESQAVTTEVENKFVIKFILFYSILFHFILFNFNLNFKF